MSTSILYHAFGLKGIEYKATHFWGWLAGIPPISAKMLRNFVRPVDHDLFKHHLTLGDIMSVRPGYDNR